MAVSPIITFECSICFSNSNLLPTKYKCSTCPKQICDDCFIRHIQTKKDCVFCRKSLIINEEDLPIEIPNQLSKWYTFCIRHKKSVTIIAIFLVTWYCFLLIYLFHLFPIMYKHSLLNNTSIY